MQKIVNVIAIASGVVSLTVVGIGGYVFIRKDAIIESAKERIQNAVLGSITPDLGGIAGDAIPDFTGGAAPLPLAPDAPSAPVSPF